MAAKADIIQNVGENLALVPVGQDLEDQDKTRISEAYEQAYDRLKEEGLASWASTAEVPTRVVPFFTDMISERLLTKYSVPDARYTRIKTDAGQNGENAMRKIAEVVLPDYDSINDSTDY